MKTQFSTINAVVALILVSAGSAWADTVSLDAALENPFGLSRYHANLHSAETEKEPVPTKSDIPEPGDGHLLSDFVYYNSLETQGVSLFGGGAGGGFPIGGIVTGDGGEGGTGGTTQTGSSGGDDHHPDENSIPQNPAPGAALLGIMGMSMVGWVRRRWA